MNTRFSNFVKIRYLGGCFLCLLCFCVSKAQADKPQPTSKTTPLQNNQPDKKQKAQCLFDGKKLGKWDVVKKYDFESHGPIKVKDGAIDIGAGSPASGIRWTGKLPRIDYEISLEAKRTTGSDFFCGLTFPINKSYCSLIIGGWGGSIIGLSNIDGSAASENESCTVGEFENNHWYKIRLRVSAAKIEVWIDKEKVIDQPTADHKFTIWWEQEPLRPLGIATWETGSAVKNIRLKRLVAPVDKKDELKDAPHKAGSGNAKK